MTLKTDKNAPTQLDPSQEAILEMAKNTASKSNKEPVKTANQESINKKIQDSREAQGTQESQNKKPLQESGERYAARESSGKSRSEKINEQMSQYQMDSSKEENQKILQEQRKKNFQQNKNARTWRPSESRELPRKARSVIKLAEQQKSQNTHNSNNQNKASLSNPQASQANTTNAQNQNKASQQANQNIQGNRHQETSSPQLKLIYSQNKQTNNSQNKPFSQRFETPKLIFNHLDKLAKQKLNVQKNQNFKLKTENQAKQQQTFGAKFINQKTVIIREGQKMRLFQKEKDKRDELKELQSEDSSEHPLSAKAKDALIKVLRQKNTQQGKKDGEELLKEFDGDINEEALANLIAQNKDLPNNFKDMNFEVKFALLLYCVLENHKKIGKKLPGNKELIPSSKKDWIKFFNNLIKSGNVETSNSKSMDKVVDLILRGFFKKMGKKGTYLIGDLNYQKAGKARQEKLVQILIDEKTHAKLSQLKTGDKIRQETLAKLFGDQLDYTSLKHQVEKKYVMAEGLAQAITFNPKSSVDPYSQAKFEQSLFNYRLPDTESNTENSSKNPKQQDQSVFANVYELLGLRKRFENDSQKYTKMAYLIIGSLIAVAIVVITLSVL